MSNKTTHENALNDELRELATGNGPLPVLRKLGMPRAMVAPYGRPEASLDHYRDMAAGIAAKAAKQGDTRGAEPSIAELLLRMETRMVRIETRVTNTMRYLGFPPRAPLASVPMGFVTLKGDSIVVTGGGVPIRDIQFMYSRMNPAPKKDVKIILNNMLWATLHVNPSPAAGYVEGDTDEN